MEQKTKLCKQERTLSRRRWVGLLTGMGCLAMTAGCAGRGGNVVMATPEAFSADTRVRVAFADENTFAEFVEQPYGMAALHREWMLDLQKHLLARLQSQLSAGQRISVVITDIKLAGRYEAIVGHAGADEVRMVRSMYPPRIHLRFRLRSADGRVTTEASRNLVSMAFMQRPNIYPESDALRYEKQLLDMWVREEFGER